MQKIATRVFIWASVAFGILGLILVLTGTDPGDNSSVFATVVSRLFQATVFIILPSFGLSVAGKYLKK